jgi:hypothetical protein
MTTVSQYGISANLPSGWEGRIYNRGEQDGSTGVPATQAAPNGLSNPVPDSGVAGAGLGAPTGGPAASGRTNPILHLANFALPMTIGDYGGAAVETMTNEHLFIAFVEFSPESAGTELFKPTGMPKLRADDFDPNCLQHALAGQGGAQKFFTINGRPFCLYVVLGSHKRRVRTVPVVNDAIGGITVS